MQKILLAAIFLLAAALLPAQTLTTASVFFDLDKYELSPDARKTLDALALQLLAAPDYAVNIEAWTDDLGTQEYNLRLANNRADAVQQYLAGKGLSLTKTSVRSWGEENLEYDNTTEENRRKNRRVDVAITSFFFDDYASFQNRLSAQTEQKLTIRPDVEQTVTAANGTLVVVPANSFVFEDGTSPSGPVELIVREAFSPSDYILQNLTTTSNGKVLQTGGMVYLDAQADGKPLAMADGASLTVALPTGNVDPNMELFYGQMNADNSIDWKPARQQFRRQLKNPRITLDIDPALSARIMALQLAEYPEPPIPAYADELPPAEPRMPTAPYAPRAPKEPMWEDVQRMYGGGYGASRNRLSKKELKKAKKHYERLLANYKRDSASYVKLYERYQTNLANYQEAMVRYEVSHREWDAEIQSRIGTLIRFEREQYLHDFSKSLQLSIKRIGKNIQKYEYYSNLEYAVESAALQEYRVESYQGFKSGTGSKKMINNLYGKCIGSKVINSSGFESMKARAKFACGRDTAYRVVNRMLESCGLVAISDSLKGEIRDKRLLTASSTGQASVALNAYVADVTRLGWINCDKFYNDPVEKVQLAVNEPEDATIYVICKDIGSILSFSSSGNGMYTARGLPKGKKVSVISIKLKDGVPQFASREVNAGETGALNMDYRSMSIRDLREELKRLNI